MIKLINELLSRDEKSNQWLLAGHPSHHDLLNLGLRLFTLVSF